MFEREQIDAAASHLFYHQMSPGGQGTECKFDAESLVSVSLVGLKR